MKQLSVNTISHPSFEAISLTGVCAGLHVSPLVLSAGEIEQQKSSRGIGNVYRSQCVALNGRRSRRNRHDDTVFFVRCRRVKMSVY